jgi:hypothetical protein
MRKSARIAALTASLAIVLSGGLAATAAGASSSNGHLGGNVRTVNLHNAYQARLGHSHAGKLGGIVRPRGWHGPAPKAATACSEPNCPLVYNGGPVQHSPKVWLLLWGPNWSSDSSQAATASYLESFLGGLGAQPNDTWSTSMSQYGDGTGHPAFTGSVYRGATQDTSTPPSGVTPNQLAAEADAFAAQMGISGNDAQIVVATQSGTSPNGFGTQYCAWHSSSSVPFTNLPYVLDAGQGCGEDFVNASGTRDGFSIVEGHEYAETVTDPQVEFGWWDPNDSSGGENGDKCAWDRGQGDPAQNITLSTGSFPVQALWSNDRNKCVISESAQQFAVNPVKGLTASPRYTQITATWKASLHATSYRLRLRTLSGTLVTQATITGTSYIFHNLKTLHTYVVNVLANPAAPNATIAKVTTKTK